MYAACVVLQLCDADGSTHEVLHRLTVEDKQYHLRDTTSIHALYYSTQTKHGWVTLDTRNTWKQNRMLS